MSYLDDEFDNDITEDYMNQGNTEMPKDFIKEVLETLKDANTFGEFTITDYKEDKFKKGVWYGKAKDSRGLTTIGWSTEGHSLTYFGEKLEPNQAVGIKKDADTRNVFSGYCFTKEDFIRVLKLTW